MQPILIATLLFLASCSTNNLSESVLATCSQKNNAPLRWANSKSTENFGDPVVDDKGFCQPVGKGDAICVTAYQFCVRSNPADAICTNEYQTCVQRKQQNAWFPNQNNCSWNGKCLIHGKLVDYKVCTDTCNARDEGRTCERACWTTLNGFIQAPATATTTVSCYDDHWPCAYACADGSINVPKGCAKRKPAPLGFGRGDASDACNALCNAYCKSKNSTCVQPICVEESHGNFCQVCNRVVNDVAVGVTKNAGGTPAVDVGFDICRLEGGDININCFGGTVDFKNDNQNCGKCGNKCATPNQICVQGQCQPCSVKYDLSSDEENCGACGRRCGRRDTCDGGACVDIGT